MRGGEGHTANKVLNSTRPTAALRTLPLTNKYPISTIDSADNTIKAVRQLVQSRLILLKQHHLRKEN
jgi:hypothetical protein